MHPRKNLFEHDVVSEAITWVGTLLETYLKTFFYSIFIDGMAFRDNFTHWLDKSQSEEKQILDSFATTCRNQKVE